LTAAAGSIIGALVICEAFVQILKDHLQEELDAIALERSETALKAPDPQDGYAISRLMAFDYTPSIRVFKDTSNFKEGEVHLIGAPRTKFQFIRVTARYGDVDDIVETEAALFLYARAIEAVLLQYWRGHADEACMRDVRIATDEERASIRERFTQESMTSLGDVSESADDEDDLVIRVEQSVRAVISFTK
jgi:hypothetical protein